jgi:hypothetical protein
MLGHKSATMTLDLYGHLFPDRLDTVSDALDAARAAALEASVSGWDGTQTGHGHRAASESMKANGLWPCVSAGQRPF